MGVSSVVTSQLGGDAVSGNCLFEKRERLPCEMPFQEETTRRKQQEQIRTTWAQGVRLGRRLRQPWSFVLPLGQHKDVVFKARCVLTGIEFNQITGSGTADVFGDDDSQLVISSGYDRATDHLGFVGSYRHG